MTDRKRIKKLLAAFMTDGPTTERPYLNQYRRLKYRQSRHPRREQIITETFLFIRRKEQELLNGKV